MRVDVSILIEVMSYKIFYLLVLYFSAMAYNYYEITTLFIILN
jgi:hypothetical protein